MKVLGLILPLALVAVALQFEPTGQPATGDAVVLSGIDGGGRPGAACDTTDGTPTRGCQLDESKRIVLAGISGGDRP